MLLSSAQTFDLLRIRIAVVLSVALCILFADPAFAQSNDTILPADQNTAPVLDAQQNAEDSGILPDALPDDTRNDENNMDELGFVEAEDGFIPAAEMISDDNLQNNADDNVQTGDAIHVYEEDVSESGFKLPNPVYEITSIHIVGNIQTSRDRILKMMGLAIGDSITLDELEESRIRLAVSGAFKSVEFSLNPGRSSGTIDVTVQVEERLKLQVNNYWLGSSDKSPFWMGFDVTWVAPFTRPHRFNFAFASTTTSDYSLTLGYLVPSLAQLPISLFASAYSSRSHEGVFGSRWLHPDDNSSERDFVHLDDLTYLRHGLNLGFGYSLNESFRFMIRVQYDYLKQSHKNEAIDSVLDKFLRRGVSHAPSASLIAMFDNRPGRNMPSSGHLAMFSVNGTAKSAISDYQFIRLSLFHQSNFNFHQNHILRIQSNAGLMYGDAPFFVKFFYNDFYSLAPSRFLRLNASSRGAYDLFNTGASSLGYEDYLVNLALTYAYQPQPRKIELFVTAAGTYADSFKQYPVALGIRPRSQRGDFPIDMSFNAGVRFDTPYGLFSITLAHIFNFIRE